VVIRADTWRRTTAHRSLLLSWSTRRAKISVSFRRKGADHRVHADPPRIQVVPDRLSGRPTIRDRRVPTAMVAKIAEDEEGRTLLRKEFGLSDEEIEEAVGYEADVKQALA